MTKCCIVMCGGSKNKNQPQLTLHRGVSHPKEIKYVGYVRFWMRVLGAWPARALNEPQTLTSTNGFLYFSTCLVALCLSLMVAFVRVYVNIWSFMEMGQVYINTFMCAVCMTRQVIPLNKGYAKLVCLFLNEMHLFHHKHVSDYAMKMHLFVHKISLMFSTFTLGAMVLAYILYNTIPLYNNWTGGGYGSNMPANFSFEYAITYHLPSPLDYSRDMRVHIGLLLFILYTGVMCSVCFSVFDLFLSLQMFHLWGHLKILIHSLENFPRPADLTFNCYSEEEIPDVSRRLKDIVVHHNLILRYMENISSTFGLAIGTYYLFHQLSNCVLLLEMSSLDPKTLLRYGPLSLLILQLQVQISAIFELVNSMTDKLIRAVYSLPWELMDVPNRRAVQAMLVQSQRPLGLKAVGMVEVGMQTTFTILKTTLSYFIMLKTIAAE